jgi:hypothetical protein
MFRANRARTTLVGFATAAALASALAAPTMALSPTTVEEHFTRVLPNHCPDFAIASIFYVDRRVETFYDAGGRAIRQVIYGVFPGEVHNLATGYSLPAENVRIVTVDLLTGESMSRGTNVRVSLPGGGTIQLTSGLQIRDASGAFLLEEGRLDQPPTPALCQALAG